MEYNVLVMECLQTKDLSRPPPWCVLLVTSTLVQWNLNLTKELAKFVHHNKVFKYPGSVFLKLLLLLGLGSSFITPRPSICRGSSLYLGIIYSRLVVLLSTCHLVSQVFESNWGIVGHPDRKSRSVDCGWKHLWRIWECRSKLNNCVTVVFRSSHPLDQKTPSYLAQLRNTQKPPQKRGKKETGTCLSHWKYQWKRNKLDREGEKKNWLNETF